ncbi:MAG: hypothetical protein IID44_26270 [Planctomycetes bacterium]|nr:hypothetical protein [Planctomycetota bacterium]
MVSRIWPLLTLSILFTLSLAGSVILCYWLRSYATVSGTGWEAGGTLAGFVILYSLLYCTLIRMQRPSLNVSQTLALTHFFQTSVVHEILDEVFGLIDQVEAGDEIPSDEELELSVVGIRHRMRETMAGFVTPLGTLNAYLYDQYEPFFDKDFRSVMAIIRSDTPVTKKRDRISTMMDARADSLRAKYLADMQRAEVWTYFHVVWTYFTWWVTFAVKGKYPAN